MPLRPGHPLFPVQTRAALACHWPVLHIWASSEAALEARWGALPEALVPTPQAEVIEPWDDEAWALRVALPGLRADVWAATEMALGDAEWALVAGWSDGRQAAWDRGWLLAEAHPALELVAERPVTPGGDAVSLDLVRPEPDDDSVLDAIARQLAEALPPGLQLHSDRGPDTVAAFVHRTTGRFGVEVAVRVDELDGRGPVLDAVAQVVAARADGPAPLAPDLQWDTGLDMVVVRAFFALPSTAPLPVDGAGAWMPDDGPEVEHQVRPNDPAQHDDIVASAAAWAERAGLAGGPARWWDGRFVPSWTGPAVACDVPHSQWRVVAAVPDGLADLAPVLDPVWHAGPHRCLARWRDAVVDRDRLEVVEERPRMLRDAELDLLIMAALATHGAVGLLPAGGMPSRAIVADGVSGLELAFDRSAFGAAPLARVLDAMCAVDHAELTSTGTWAHKPARTLVRLWFHGDGVADWA